MTSPRNGRDLKQLGNANGQIIPLKCLKSTGRMYRAGEIYIH
nr:MAG TPA: hypothetical protein [Caudoviricetes sp.]